MLLPTNTSRGRSSKRDRDAITRMAQAAVLALQPHERLLLACGLNLRQLASRVGFSHASLRVVFTRATTSHRMSLLWIGRLATATGLPDHELRALFGIPEQGVPEKLANTA